MECVLQRSGRDATAQRWLRTGEDEGINSCATRFPASAAFVLLSRAARAGSSRPGTRAAAELASASSKVLRSERLVVRYARPRSRNCARTARFGPEGLARACLDLGGASGRSRTRLSRNLARRWN